MKTRCFAIAMLLLVGMICTGVNAQDQKKEKRDRREKKEMTKVDQEKLPKEAHDFISKYFPGDEIVTVEADGQMMRFEVKLGSTTEIDFNKDGKWFDIENDKGIAVSAQDAFPQGIRDYVTKNYQNKQITNIERRPFGYEVEVNTVPEETDLYFDKDGKYLTPEQLQQMRDQRKDMRKDMKMDKSQECK